MPAIGPRVRPYPIAWDAGSRIGLGADVANEVLVVGTVGRDPALAEREVLEEAARGELRPRTDRNARDGE
jgi:hypothetical protein